MNARSVEAPQWWSIPQAIAWIVERSEGSVERAAKLHLIRSLPFLTPGLKPTSGSGSPPVSLAAAPAELLRAARAGRITIRGRLWGGGELVRVPVQLDDKLQDHKDAPCIGGTDVYRGGRFWSGLFIRSDECMSEWPASVRAHANAAKDIDGRCEESQIPTYLPVPNYSAGAVPEQFMRWAEVQHLASVIITVPMAEDAMRGPKDSVGNRSGGILKQGNGLSRETIRAWVRTLNSEWVAKQGETPSRRKSA